jgi:hypothetical protein
VNFPERCWSSPTSLVLGVDRESASSSIAITNARAVVGFVDDQLQFYRRASAAARVANIGLARRRLWPLKTNQSQAPSERFCFRT